MRAWRNQLSHEKQPPALDAAPSSTPQGPVFFGGDKHPLIDPPWDIAFTIDRNTCRRRTPLQLIIQDVRAAVSRSTNGKRYCP